MSFSICLDGLCKKNVCFLDTLIEQHSNHEISCENSWVRRGKKTAMKRKTLPCKNFPSSCLNSLCGSHSRSPSFSLSLSPFLSQKRRRRRRRMACSVVGFRKKGLRDLWQNHYVAVSAMVFFDSDLHRLEYGRYIE